MTLAAEGHESAGTVCFPFLVAAMFSAFLYLLVATPGIDPGPQAVRIHFDPSG